MINKNKKLILQQLTVVTETCKTNMSIVGQLIGLDSNTNWKK